MHEIPRMVLIPLPRILGVDLSITNEVLYLWLAAVATFALVTLACRRGRVARGAFQNAFEAVIEFIENEVVRGTLGKDARGWSVFLLSLFFFILFANLLGMLPLPQHLKAATSSLSVTAGLALLVFAITVVVNLRRNGVVGFLRKFVPSGVPRWVAILVIPIEVVSWLAKPVSLALRLCANMAAGHALILVFIGLEMTVLWFLVPLPLAGAVIMEAFELFVCFIQAFIFTLLAGMYVREALAPAGEH
jgi:F-type H+-transporting ATPase subunit a